MLSKRWVVLLGGCFLMASGTWADDLGYVNCANHSEDTQVFAKARVGQEKVASVPCGERFTILLNGFVFSRVMTRDGKIGYVLSNLISIDRTGNATLQPASERVPVPASRGRETTAATAKPNAGAPAQSRPGADPSKAGQDIAVQASAAEPAAVSNVPQTPATVAQMEAVAPTQPQPTAAEVTPVASSPSMPTPAVAEAVAQPASSAPEAVATPAQPSPAADSRPQPVAAEPGAPAAPPIRDARARTSWENPNPGARRRTSLLELYGGYSLARLAGNGAGSATNLNGALGSFGWNIKPWLQIAADTSYNVVTVSGTKNVLYGNHYGPRFFLRGRGRWGVTPFVEALVGGSRADTAASGTGGYATSDMCISYKAGGGVDIHPSRRFEIRLLDGGYYRTTFGTNAHQNNYWASTGIVVRLFGGAE